MADSSNHKQVAFVNLADEDADFEADLKKAISASLACSAPYTGPYSFRPSSPASPASECKGDEGLQQALEASMQTLLEDETRRHSSLLTGTVFAADAQHASLRSGSLAHTTVGSRMQTPVSSSHPVLPAKHKLESELHDSSHCSKRQRPDASEAADGQFHNTASASTQPLTTQFSQEQLAAAECVANLAQQGASDGVNHKAPATPDIADEDDDDWGGYNMPGSETRFDNPANAADMAEPSAVTAPVSSALVASGNRLFYPYQLVWWLGESKHHAGRILSTDASAQPHPTYMVELMDAQIQYVEATAYQLFPRPLPGDNVWCKDDNAGAVWQHASLLSTQVFPDCLVVEVKYTACGSIFWLPISQIEPVCEKGESSCASEKRCMPVVGCVSPQQSTHSAGAGQDDTAAADTSSADMAAVDESDPGLGVTGEWQGSTAADQHAVDGDDDDDDGDQQQPSDGHPVWYSPATSAGSPVMVGAVGADSAAALIEEGVGDSNEDADENIDPSADPAEGHGDSDYANLQQAICPQPARHEPGIWSGQLQCSDRTSDVQRYAVATTTSKDGSATTATGSCL
eukprot:jgi/Chrzof1/10027/Cz04g24180.t1